MGLVYTTTRDRCRDWLLYRLENGPVDFKVIKAEAKERGFATGTLYRAANIAGVESVRKSGQWQGGTYWTLHQGGEA